jgi:nucleotide sugar dehydrogenase
VRFAGLALVLGDDDTLLGVLSDGDVRRAYARDVDFRRPVSEVMVRDPVTIPHTTPPEEIVPEVYRRVQQTERLSTQWVRHILVVDERRHLVDVHDFLELISGLVFERSKVAVFGMGYVGLTLAATLANRGHVVTGIDVNEDLVRRLGAGVPHILEAGLEDLLKLNLGRNTIAFDTRLRRSNHKVYIAAVGTPVKDGHEPDLRALLSVAEHVGAQLKQNDLVMIRSTVPVGTTRRHFIPLLERLSALRAGDDFSVAFAPERTVEGNALAELRTVPQIVGGLSARCLQRAAAFWSTVTASVVQVPSLEAAELVKLANNSFRDISFGFANELALLAAEYNVNAFELIQAANRGYPRNPIPAPSPGVGGYCLTKDPLLFAAPQTKVSARPELGIAARRANQRATEHPLAVLDEFGRRHGLPLAEMKVLIIGLAFKGEPETADLRHSTSLDVARALMQRGARVLGWDAAVDRAQIAEQGIEPVGDLEEAFRLADATLVLNNHRRNIPTGLFSRPITGKKLVFDGWGQLDAREIEQIPGMTYATMGYITPAAGA